MKNLLLSALCLGLGLPLYAQKKAPRSDFNTTKARMEFEFMQTYDPATGTVPTERLHQALKDIEEESQGSIPLHQSRLLSPAVVANPR